MFRRFEVLEKAVMVEFPSFNITLAEVVCDQLQDKGLLFRLTTTQHGLVVL